MSETPNYMEAMKKIQESRASEVYGHLWMRHLNRYGLVAYFWELAGILGRLEHILVRTSSPVDRRAKVKDLLLDLGNYAGFMYEWICRQEEAESQEEFRRNLP